MVKFRGKKVKNGSLSDRGMKKAWGGGGGNSVSSAEEKGGQGAPHLCLTGSREPREKTGRPRELKGGGVNLFENFKSREYESHWGQGGDNLVN